MCPSRVLTRNQVLANLALLARFRFSLAHSIRSNCFAAWACCDTKCLTDQVFAPIMVRAGAFLETF